MQGHPAADRFAVVLGHKIGVVTARDLLPLACSCCCSAEPGAAAASLESDAAVAIGSMMRDVSLFGSTDLGSAGAPAVGCGGAATAAAGVTAVGGTTSGLVTTARAVPATFFKSLV